jgi:hypothetical protein
MGFGNVFTLTLTFEWERDPKHIIGYGNNICGSLASDIRTEFGTYRNSVLQRG